jgi:prepilin peptidase CpaA
MTYGRIGYWLRVKTAGSQARRFVSSQDLDRIFMLTALACALIGAACDIRSRRIPNWLTGTSILLGLALHLSLQGWIALGTAALAGAIGGGIFLLVYLGGGMGAGDVKLMAAVSVLAGLGHVREVLVATTLLGGVFAVVFAVFRGRFKAVLANVVTLITHHGKAGLTPHPELNITNPLTLRLPYGIAVAAGAAVSSWNALLR